ncbi:MAG: phosphoglucosamine mutase [Pyrinomonadaceae bacterium]
MKKLFGTDGIRGKAGEFPLDAETIEIIGKSLAKQFHNKSSRNPRFILGRDTRESGIWIEEAFCRGALASGAHCESADIITTPGVAFLAKEFDFDAGIVISASHNPFQDNGIKIFTPDGKKIDQSTESKIETDVFQSPKSKVQSSESDLPQRMILTPQLRQRIEMLQMTSLELSNLIRQETVSKEKAVEMQNQYLNYLADEFKTLDLKNFRMVIDCAHGAAYRLAPQLFEKFKAETIVINNTPDGKNINKNCGSLHLEHLQKKVLDEKADFGVAFDGDADRSLFVDEKGNLVDGDAVLWIMAQHLQDNQKLNNQTVVATVMSNIGLEIALHSKNIKLLRTDVGDKYVLQELLKTNAALGGEQSGHIIIPFHSLVGDGMLTTLFLLEALRANGKTLSDMTEGFVRFPQILVNVKVREKIPFESVAEINQASAKIKKDLGAKGRLLLRYSGTENLARVMIEGENQVQIEAQANHLAEIIGRNLN